MSETQNNSFAASESEELDTTPPNPASTDTPAGAASPTAPGNWEMPKPVFRRTSGKLASSFEKKVAHEMDEQAGSSEDGPQGITHLDSAGSTDKAGTAAEFNVEPQPELAEVLIPEELDTPRSAAVPKGKSGSYGLLFTLLGLALILGLIALILAVVYFFFFRPAGSGTLF
jgi:hypothetical protein